MRIRPRRSVRSVIALVAAGGLVLVGAGTASADLIVNGVDDSVDTVVEQMPLSLSTGPGTTTLYVVPAEGDNDPGCNFDGASETVTVDLTVDKPEVATVSPTSLVLTGCGAAAAKTVTVTPVGVGTATVTTAVTAGTNRTGGTFSVANARFSTRVTSVPNTPPTLAIFGVEEGGAYPKGTVARPQCVATDVDDFPTPPHTTTWLASMTEISGPYAGDNIGTRYAMCSYVDDSGVQVLARKGFSIVDESAPGISRVLDPAADGLGWFRGDVSLDWTVTEAQSPSSLQMTGCEDQLLTVDTKLTSYTCTAISAGGSHSVVQNIRRDTTAPAISPTSTIVGGGTVVNGWYTSRVGVTFTATDETSQFLVDGRTVGTRSQTVNTTEDGEVTVQSPAFTDRAGNTSAAGAVQRTIKVDTTAPAVPAFVGGPSGSHYFGDVPATPICTSSDTGSGLASCVITGGGTAVGKHSYTATATDDAGHTSTAQLPYEILAWTAKDFTAPIDMGGVFNTVKGGSTVPTKFEIFAGTKELTDPSVVTFSNRKIACTTGAPADGVETVTTGNTSLKYDATAGQFQYNWKLPTGAGTCYELKMTARDGSSVTANFRLK